MGDRAAAERSFEEALERNPEQTVSLYRHTPEVVALFHQVQTRIRRAPVDLPPPPPPPVLPRRRLPLWGYAPFGIPQFRQGGALQGSLFLVAQLGSAAGSVALYAQIGGHWTEEEKASKNTLRVAAPWPLTLGFYGAWLGSHLEARRRWRRTPTVAPMPVVTFDRNTVRLTVASHF